MDTDTIWHNIDTERADLAVLVAGLSDEQWATPSSCAGWTVGDVAVHLTQAVTPPWRMLAVAVRSGFRFNTIIRRAAVADPQPPCVVADRLRAMVGCRRHPISTQPVDSLFDVLVHGRDIAIPLGIERAMPSAAAAAAVQRMWPSRYPFHPARDNPGIRFVASDVDFEVGEGRDVELPIARILLIVAGRESVPIN